MTPDADGARMNFEAVIDRLLREQTDQTNVLETLWLLFAHHVKIPPGGVQWIESRRCFFAGALTLFSCLIRILEPGAEPTEADLRRMDRITGELARYAEDLTKGTA